MGQGAPLPPYPQPGTSLCIFLEKGKGLKNRASKKNEKQVYFCIFVDPFFLANSWVWQKTVMTIGSGVKNYVEIRIRKLKSSTDDPKTAIFHFFDIFLTEPGEGP